VAGVHPAVQVEFSFFQQYQTFIRIHYIDRFTTRTINNILAVLAGNQFKKKTNCLRVLIPRM
jgi:hypothetical protein